MPLVAPWTSKIHFHHDSSSTFVSSCFVSSRRISSHRIASQRIAAHHTTLYRQSLTYFCFGSSTWPLLLNTIVSRIEKVCRAYQSITQPAVLTRALFRSHTMTSPSHASPSPLHNHPLIPQNHASSRLYHPPTLQTLLPPQMKPAAARPAPHRRPTRRTPPRTPYHQQPPPPPLPQHYRLSNQAPCLRRL